MQAVTHRSLGKRARYYHSQIDMELLIAGAEYSKLPKTYVIFICDFDPFKLGKYRYTFMQQCQEGSEALLDDGSMTIFLNTRGKNPSEVPNELVKFLMYVRADLNESTADFEDDFVDSLQKSVYDIKQSRRMEERYMLTELLMQDERRAGRIEGRIEERRDFILEFLSEIGEVPQLLQDQIVQEESLEKLRAWAKLAAKVETIEQFMEDM